MRLKPRQKACWSTTGQKKETEKRVHGPRLADGEGQEGPRFSSETGWIALPFNIISKGFGWREERR